MDMVLTGPQWNNCTVYIDDIIAARKTSNASDHDEHLDRSIRMSGQSWFETPAQ